MAVRERYQYVVDLVVDNANRALSTFGGNVDGVERSTGRLQGTLGRAGDFLRGHMAEAAMAAGTALVAFGVQSVKAFQDTALAAGKLADATGLTVEESSRWLEVAGDLGISGEQLTSMFARLERSIGANPDKLRELGIEMQTNADGSVNMTDTMLRAIEAIKGIEDPTERARVSQETFGRSYTEVAELIEAGADNVTTALGEVSDSKVIDPEELEKARRMREAMDNLADVVEDVSLALGEALVPALSEAAEGVTGVDEAIRGMTGGSQGLGDVLGNTVNFALKGVSGGVNDLARGLIEAEQATEQSTEQLRELDGAAQRAATRTRTLSNATSDLGDEIDETAEAFATLKGELSDEQAFLSLARAYDNLASAGQQSAIEQRADVVALKGEILEYAQQVENLPPSKVTEILAQIDEGDLAEVERLLNIAARNRFVRFTAGVAGGGAIDGPDTGPRTRTGVGAAGGIVTQATRAIIGEAGPEAVIPLDQMPGASPLPGGSGGSGVTLVVQGNIYGDSHFRDMLAREVDAAIAKANRINGPGRV